MTVEFAAPLSFERVGRAQAAGCFAYLLMVPMLCLIGVIAGSGIGYALGSLFGGGTDALTLIFAPVGFVGAAWFGIRDYRRRSASRIVIHSDRLEQHRPGSPALYRFEELEWIEGPSLTQLIVKGSGLRLVLRAEEWPIEAIAQALRTQAVPAITRRLRERIDAGSTVEIRPTNQLALQYLITGTFFTTLAVLLFYYWFIKIRIEKTFKSYGVPILLLSIGLTALVQVARARDGLTLDRDGIRKRPADPVIPWASVRGMTLGPEGVTLNLQEGSTIGVGSLARNYEAGVALIHERLEMSKKG